MSEDRKDQPIPGHGPLELCLGPTRAAYGFAEDRATMISIVVRGRVVLNYRCINSESPLAIY